MALRSKVVFRAVGYALVAIAILGFTLRLISKVATGHSLETYRSGTLVQWSYGAALVALVVLAFAVIVALSIRGISWLRTRRELNRLAQAHGKLGSNQG
jgi:hypothetical protein